MTKRFVTSDRFLHTASSLLFCGQALNELDVITTPFSKPEENSLLSKAPFPFYRASLTYVVVVEFYKLFEDGKSKDKPRMSSLPCLLKEVRQLSVENEVPLIDGLIANVQDIRRTEVAEKLHDFRLKRFAHSDLHEINRPMKIPGLTLEEIDSTFGLLFAMEAILNSVAKLDDETFQLLIPKTASSQTETFIHTASAAWKYYFDHQRDALSKGYADFSRRDRGRRFGGE